MSLPRLPDLFDSVGFVEVFRGLVSLILLPRVYTSLSSSSLRLSTSGGKDLVIKLAVVVSPNFTLAR